MKLGDLLAGIPLTGGNYNKELEIKSISYDTRTLKKDDFVLSSISLHISIEFPYLFSLNY